MHFSEEFSFRPHPPRVSLRVAIGIGGGLRPFPPPIVRRWSLKSMPCPGFCFSPFFSGMVFWFFLHLFWRPCLFPPGYLALATVRQWIFCVLRGRGCGCCPSFSQNIAFVEIPRCALSAPPLWLRPMSDGGGRPFPGSPSFCQPFNEYRDRTTGVFRSWRGGLPSLRICV